MGKPINGMVVLVKSIIHHEVWLADAFSRGQAFVDLILLANDSPRSLFIRDKLLTVGRGQLAHSIGSLGVRWRWSAEKVTGFLRWLDSKGMIQFKPSNLTTVITITNYETYQALCPGLYPEAETGAGPVAETAAQPDAGTGAAPAASSVARPAQNGNGNGKEGAGAPPQGLETLPTDADVFAFAEAFAGEPATGLPGPIPAGFAAGFVSSCHQKQQWPFRWTRALVASWRAHWLRSNRGGTDKKNAAPLTQSEQITREQQLRRIQSDLSEARDVYNALNQCGDDTRAARAEVTRLELALKAL